MGKHLLATAREDISGKIWLLCRSPDLQQKRNKIHSFRGDFEDKFFKEAGDCLKGTCATDRLSWRPPTEGNKGEGSRRNQESARK
ncbi:hypothetical protein I79_010057 [Cricetulus griseus]|uniref:Uncharacterized protein n=1 Tax=Cricetulus griseus TaxID=10029 RepID=G3HHF6_CRIGR|nr:hypothetical protein I79_010057 [Cricetulus griseus]